MNNPFDPRLPVYHPCSINLIDDDEIFLDSLRAYMGRHHASYCFTSPQQALVHLEKTHTTLSEINTLMQQFYTSISEGKVQENASGLFFPKYVATALRFKMPSVIIVDYEMPGMTGLEFCEKTIQIPSRKILLTGKATASQVIDGFNNGLIHGFISKSAPNALPQIREVVQKLHAEFLSYIYGSYKNTLEAPRGNDFNHPDIEALLSEIYQEFAFSEYYYSPIPRSFLLINEEGLSKLCLLKLEREMFDEADFLDEEIGPSIASQALRTSSSLAFNLIDWRHDETIPDKNQNLSKRTFFRCRTHKEWRWALVPSDQFSDAHNDNIWSWSRFKNQTRSLAINTEVN